MAMDTVDWRQARQWLIDTGVIPPTHRVTKPDVTLLDFARSLRDGVFLCSLLNKLKPGSVKYTARPVMQHSYLNNINAFLTACDNEFNISSDDLFTDSELYDVDNFSKVMSTLSKLSYTQEALSRGWKPFPSDENRDYYNDPASNGEDIYASLQDVSAQTSVYANVSDLYQDTFNEDETFGYGDEKIYDSVLRYQAHPITEANTQDEQRLAILKELYETEKSFSEVLSVIAKDYFDVLRDYCNDDLRALFTAAQKLLPFHEQLRDGLEKCANPKPNLSEVDVGNCFFEVETGLLEYGVYAAVLPQATEKAKALQNQRDTGRLMQATMERSPQSRFPLSDILPVPIQRVMRYPLLIKELEKSAKKASQQAQMAQMERLMNLLEDIAKYINITKGDYDTVRTIEELESNLTEYKGPKLSQCGRYHLDGELRMKAMDRDREEPKSRWVFLFDKVVLVTSRRQWFTSVRYTVKAYHEVANMTVEPVSNIRRASQHAFRIKIDGKAGSSDSVEYTAYAKNDQLKLLWTDAVKKARDIICPKAGKSRHHSFEYYNFETAKKCSCCQRLLLGSYFQGYLCTECGAISHRDCLSRQLTCSAVKPPRVPMHSPLMPQASLDASIQRWNNRSRSNGTDCMPIPAGTRRTYVATQRFGAFGHRRDTYLSFERGDEIEIINNSDPEKWEGIHTKTNTRGFVSSHYLIRKAQGSIPVSSPSPRAKQMSDYAWYIGRKTRIDAEVALHKQRDGVFLIRESMDRPGEYAVALRWKNMPKHIKIMKNSQTDKLYVSDACDFDSIPDLVEYYHKNTLGQSFPGVNTTLRYPYLDVIEGRVNFPERRHHSLTSNSGMPPPSFPAPTPIPPPTMSPPSHSIGGSWSNDMSNWQVIGEAICDFNGEGQGQLSFAKHDVVKVINKDTKRLGWWFGECNGRTGLFRADHIYVKEDLR